MYIVIDLEEVMEKIVVFEDFMLLKYSIHAETPRSSSQLVRILSRIISHNARVNRTVHIPHTCVPNSVVIGWIH